LPKILNQFKPVLLLIGRQLTTRYSALELTSFSDHSAERDKFYEQRKHHSVLIPTEGILTMAVIFETLHFNFED